ncbi:MAG TPA: DUF1501 domain-containing protein [Tepidisphaeraceae bacterium]|nr:DUF1501 domain-containing protein [Tepidisphaeraceae bacterium]
MNHALNVRQAPLIDRRGLLRWASAGIGAVALSALLLRDGVADASEAVARQHQIPHFLPRAKRVIHLCAMGGVSQVDTFDYKPALQQLHGKSLGGGAKPDVFFGKVGLLRKSDFPFTQFGRSGHWISSLFPHLGTVADELCIVKSMIADTSNHTPAAFQQLTGFRLNGFPTMGAWVSYGLGNMTENLPAFVVIPDARQLPPGGSINWTNGFLPARHQGVVMRAGGTAIDDLQPARNVDAATEADSRALLARMNRRHLQAHGGEDLLAARLKSYELAAQMQLAVPEVSSLDAETPAMREMYGIGKKETNDFGRGCLLARRLLERGVRFVQLFSGGALGSPRINWDGHEDCRANHAQEALRVDQPIAALLKDLRQRGMLDDTLVLFTSEFGRTPFTQAEANQIGAGRDHNQYGFSIWLAGGGIKPGISYGSTDETGWKAAENIVAWPDLHATVLNTLGIDHRRLTFYHNGIQRRLTNVSGEVVREILA